MEILLPCRTVKHDTKSVCWLDRECRLYGTLAAFFFLPQMWKLRQSVATDVLEVLNSADRPAIPLLF